VAVPLQWNKDNYRLLTRSEQKEESHKSRRIHNTQHRPSSCDVTETATFHLVHIQKSNADFCSAYESA